MDRAKLTEEMKECGIDVGTDMVLTDAEKKEAREEMRLADETQTMYIAQLKLTKCKICGGWGHLAIKCPTFKYMEKFTKTAPAMRIAWGKMKGTHI